MDSVDGVLLEVALVEVRIHVQPGGSKVEGARDVWDDALPTFTNAVCSHPHIPVPQLVGVVIGVMTY